MCIFFKYWSVSVLDEKVLNPECKSRETLRQALLYLFCAQVHLASFNTSKSNKNIVGLSALFIFGVIIYVGLGLNIMTRFGWIHVTTHGTDLRGMIDYFVYFCCFPVLMPTIYFMRNPKHLISVLHDHNLISECITRKIKWINA